MQRNKQTNGRYELFLRFQTISSERASLTCVYSNTGALRRANRRDRSLLVLRPGIWIEKERKWKSIKSFCLILAQRATLRFLSSRPLVNRKQQNYMEEEGLIQTRFFDRMHLETRMRLSTCQLVQGSPLRCDPAAAAKKAVRSYLGRRCCISSIRLLF